MYYLFLHLKKQKNTLIIYINEHMKNITRNLVFVLWLFVSFLLPLSLNIHFVFRSIIFPYYFVYTYFTMNCCGVDKNNNYEYFL